MADLAETLPDTRLVYVADREGDLRALIDAAARRGTPADWLIRSKPTARPPRAKLWERIAQSEALGRGRIHLAGGARIARPGRCGERSIARWSCCRRITASPAVTVTAILAREEPPANRVSRRSSEWLLTNGQQLRLRV
ncbi:MAG: hypothetical protein R3F40_12135 [Candidatus Competibacteraceae bacterium]